MRFTACHDKLNNRCVFGCEDCYDKKDILKDLGFRWNPNTKEWQKFYNTPAELTRILMETMLRCDCPVEVYDDFCARSCNYKQLETIGDISVWDREYFAEFCAKYDLGVDNDEEESTEETVASEEQEPEYTISERDAMELVIATGLHPTPKYGWRIKPDTAEDLIRQLNKHKPTLMRYMQGECFQRQARILRRVDGVEWVLMKCTAVVDAPAATEVFSGTALEVDRWCADHADDPLFTDEYVCKYSVAWRKAKRD